MNLSAACSAPALTGCSLLADQVYTAPMQVVRPTPFGWNGTYLQFGDAIPGMAGLQGFNSGERLTGAHLLELSGPGPDYRQVASVEINADGRLVLATPFPFDPFVYDGSISRAPAGGFSSPRWKGSEAWPLSPAATAPD